MTPEELFLKYMDHLYRMALFMLFSIQDAEDIVQETYIRLLVKQPKFHDEEHAKAWLIRVCINLCKNQLRFRKRHPQDNIEDLQNPIVSTEVYEDKSMEDKGTPYLHKDGIFATKDHKALFYGTDWHPPVELKTTSIK